MNITITVPDGYLATAVVNDKPYHPTLAKMTNAALLHVFEYGLQRIVNDKTGGKDKTADDKHAAAVAMVERLEAEEYKRRAVGIGVDPIMRHVRSILRDLLKRPEFAAKQKEYKAFGEAADRDAYIDDWFDNMPDALATRIREAAAGLLAEAEARRKREAKLVDALLPDMPQIGESELIPATDRDTPAKKGAKKK